MRSLDHTGRRLVDNVAGVANPAGPATAAAAAAAAAAMRPDIRRPLAVECMLQFLDVLMVAQRLLGPPAGGSPDQLVVGDVLEVRRRQRRPEALRIGKTARKGAVLDRKAAEAQQKDSALRLTSTGTGRGSSRPVAVRSNGS